MRIATGPAIEPHQIDAIAVQINRARPHGCGTCGPDPVALRAVLDDLLDGSADLCAELELLAERAPEVFGPAYEEARDLDASIVDACVIFSSGNSAARTAAALGLGERWASLDHLATDVRSLIIRVPVLPGIDMSASPTTVDRAPAGPVRAALRRHLSPDVRSSGMRWLLDPAEDETRTAINPLRRAWRSGLPQSVRAAAMELVLAPMPGTTDYC